MCQDISSSTNALDCWPGLPQSLSSAQMVWTAENQYSLLFGHVYPKTNHYPPTIQCTNGVDCWKNSIPCCLARSTPKPTTICSISSAQMVWTAERTVFLAIWPGLPQNQPLSTHYPVHKWCGLVKTSTPCCLVRYTPKPWTMFLNNWVSPGQPTWVQCLPCNLLGRCHCLELYYIR